MLRSTKLPHVPFPAVEFAVVGWSHRSGRGVFHIPKEPTGFGNNFKPKFSAPAFDDCAVPVDKNDKIIEINLSS